MKQIPLTNEILNSFKTVNGGYTKQQLEILRISWPPEKGWKNHILGNMITEIELEQLLCLSKKKDLI